MEAYVKSCLVCQQDKTETKKNVGLLQSLPIPDRLFESISMGFIMGFSKVDGMQFVLVIVDRFSKYVVFLVAFNACLTDIVVGFFHKHYIKYFCMLKDIVSDLDACFTGRF